MHSISRRELLRRSSCGFGALALQAMISDTAAAERPEVDSLTPDLTPKPPPLPARAKTVIFLCMSGGPAQMDTFDYKPQTTDSPHPGSDVEFCRYGESGIWVSELLPQIAKHADQLCVINGMHADTGNHAQSFLQLHTGERLRQRPSWGSWVTYGLGSENQDLPGFISLNTSKPSIYSSGFLPTVFAGTPLGVNGEDMSTATIDHIAGDHLTLAQKRRQVDLIQAVNRTHRDRRSDDPRLESVIESLELGFRMQSSAPELLDLSDESAATLARYRVGKRAELGSRGASDFGRQCLLARRFAEAGVRFIELNHGSWDQHTNHRADTATNCSAIDAPIAALLDDLDQRGLLEETLVVWGGEFGRPGLVPGDGKDGTGHNHRGFTFWLAGGGVKSGFVHGQTDDTGSRAVSGKVHFRDLHATILQLLGLHHDRLSFTYEGRSHRLTGPEGGQVVEAILA